MGAKHFDYYIFIDYSENLLGYMIIETNKIIEFLPKISKFAHYKELKHKSAYLHSIKKVIERNKVLSYTLKNKIRKATETPEVYSDILEFLKKHNIENCVAYVSFIIQFSISLTANKRAINNAVMDKCLIFISIDNKQYSNFERLVKVIDWQNIKIVKESDLKKNTPEYKISLVLDTLLNIERLKHEKR